MNILSRTLLGLVVTATGATISLGAFANPTNANASRELNTIVVKYGDLNLAREAGVRDLYHRLSQAGYTVCGQIPGFDPFDLRNMDDWNACYKQAVDNAAAKVGNQRLTQMVYRRIGAPAETTVASR